ncbi:MAG TPA: zf-HC2 domain-containing protein [Thermoanaerobaculia bacterium]|jgi:anti-sigma factor (TIGR02949 family)|nr:zf-HC2 domain-containing protein [Thermoanaerobaculia bacterium]
MNRIEDDLTCDDVLDLVEPYVDGDLEAAEAERLRSHLESCRSCAAELTLAERIQAELRALPQLDCPPEIVERVRREGAQVLPFRSPVRAREAALPFRLAAAAALLAVALGGGAFFLRSQQQPKQPSAAEVARATQQARYALAYLGKVSRQASLDVRDDVLARRVVLPAAQSVSHSIGISLGEEPEKTVPARGERAQ